MEEKSRFGLAASPHLERTLLALVSAFLTVYALALTLAPAVRLRTWDVDYRWQHWLGLLVWAGIFWFLHRVLTRLPEHDPLLLPAAGLLTGWGLLTIYRLIAGFGLRQTVWLALIGLVLVFSLRRPSDLSLLRRFKYLWLSAGLALTAATLIFGANPMGDGPRLWLGCCGIYLQPSEPLKLLLIIYLAAYLADRLPRQDGASVAPSRLTLYSLGPTITLTGLALLLLFVQRDLGTASIFLFLYAAVVYAATGDWRIPLVSAGGLLLAGIAGYLLFDVVQIRIEAWLNPWLDPSGRSYQIVQSLLAVANGGLAGRGPGLGNPGLVPVPQSDFIFTAISEEFGLAGALGLIATLGLILVRGLRAALVAPDAFRRILAAGLTLHLTVQSILIIGGNLRLLPLTGVTLPFVSYGGSSLLVSMLELLCLLHISMASSEQPGYAAGWPAYRRLAGGALLGLAAVGLAAGWWGFWRGPELLTRTDNPRRSISDRFVLRGAILDRSNQTLAQSEGQPGDYQRNLLYPQLSNTIGYTHPAYGQSGLEASLDPFLRGVQGYPALTLWQHHLLYGMPPPGLDVRTSLDLQLQQTADELLGSQRGAVVLLNAQSGEVLALATHPAFDANMLDQTWETLLQDPSSPLFHRGVAGFYPPGAALGPFLLAQAIETGSLPALPRALTAPLAGGLSGCTAPPAEPTWGAATANGCQVATSRLAGDLQSTAFLDLLEQWGLFTAPLLRLPTETSLRPAALADPALAVSGQADAATGERLTVTPLQMALAAAALSNQGLRPAPWLVLAVDSPEAGWVMLPALDNPTEMFSSAAAQSVASQLADAELPIWQICACVPLENAQGVCWYLGGTLASWPGAPLAIAVLIENPDPALAISTGRGMLQSALIP